MFKKTIALSLTFLLSCTFICKAQYLSSETSKTFVKKNIVPLSLLATGILLSDSSFEKSLQNTTQDWLGNDFKSSIDDYTRFVPIVQMYAADVAGVKAKHHWFDQTKNATVSIVLTDIITNLLKKNIYKMRPNNFNEKSFPSGHTSLAFTSGTILYEEFKDTNTLLAYSGYGFSALTGGLRMANNKHYLSDVLAGAGLGILITKLVYEFDYLFAWNPFLKSKDVSLQPVYNEGNVGLYFSKTF